MSEAWGEVRGCRGDPRPVLPPLPPPRWDGSSSQQLPSPSAPHFPSSPGVTNPRVGGWGGPEQAGGPQCPPWGRGWGSGVLSLCEDPKPGGGKGASDGGGELCPQPTARGVLRAGEGAGGPPRGLPGPPGTKPTPALGFPWAESERGKAVPVPGPRQTLPALGPCLPWAGASSPQEPPKKGCHLPRSVPSLPLQSSQVAQKQSHNPNWEQIRIKSVLSEQCGVGGHSRVLDGDTRVLPSGHPVGSRREVGCCTGVHWHWGMPGEQRGPSTGGWEDTRTL